MKRLVLFILIVCCCSAQTRVAQPQVNEAVSMVPSVEVFWPKPGELSFYVATGSNREVFKIAVFVNGLLMCGASSTTTSADYTVSSDLKKVTLASYYNWIGNDMGRDIVQIWAWIRDP